MSQQGFNDFLNLFTSVRWMHMAPVWCRSGGWCGANLASGRDGGRTISTTNIDAISCNFGKPLDRYDGEMLMGYYTALQNLA